MARMKVQVVSDQPDEYTGKKGLVKQQVLTVRDICPSGFRMKDNFDYVLSESEKEKYAGKLLDRNIELNIIELRPPPFGSRLRASGSINGDPLAKQP